VIGNDTSSWCDVNIGVPQGSVQGPVLYVNDLPQVVTALFADDTKLYCSTTSNFSYKKTLITFWNGPNSGY